MSDFSESNEILVEFSHLPNSTQPGMEEVSLKIPSGEVLVKKSTQAINNAMATVKSMACKVIKNIETLPKSEQPSDVEVEFGLNLNLEGNAAIAKVVSESNIKVKLRWDNRREK